MSSVPGLERSPGGGNGNPLQYSCLENHTDRGVWQATVHGSQRVGHNLATKPPYGHLSNWKTYSSDTFNKVVSQI